MRRLACCLLIVLGLVGCGSPAASTAPASSPPATPIASPPATSSPPTAEPTSSPGDLAARLPTELRGVPLVTANDDAIFNPGATSDMGRLLTAVGASAPDIKMASAYDPTGTLPFEMIAMRIGTVRGALLAPAIDTVFKSGPSRQVEPVELSGTRVLRVTVFGEEPQRAYLFVDGDEIFEIFTSDEALAEEAVAAIVI